MRWLTTTCLVPVFLAAVHALAAEATPTLELGSTREQVIEAYGQPIGRAKFGSKEILHYHTAEVTLSNGRVERVHRKSVPAPATAPAASAPAPSADPASSHHEPLAEVWVTNFEDATRDATRRDAPIIALFTTSDASPASRQFQKEIAFHPEFVNAFRARYVMLHVDFPVRSSQPPEMVEQNEKLRSRYGVHDYPALLILSATGEKLGEVAIADAAPGNAFRGRLLAAVTAAHPLPEPTAAAPTPAPAPGPVVAPPPTEIHVAPAEVTSGLTMARWLVASALIVGILVAAVMLFVLWLVLRKFNKPAALTQQSSMASRIDHAASGLPTHEEIAAWPKDTLCRVITRLAEREGFVVEPQRRGSDKDLLLKRPGNPLPEVIVCCVTGSAGVIPTRKIREMVGMLAADDVQAGWFIAPMGFSLDACTYAEQHNIRLIDGAGVLEQLSDLPTFALPKVLAVAP